MGALPKPMDLKAFLSWEKSQELRHEFDGVTAKAMTGGTGAHVAIEMGLAAALYAHLRSKPCRPFGSNLKIKLAQSVRYPDASVVCTPIGPRETSCSDPVVVFEILSASTVNEDLGPKRSEYQATPSIQRYVVLQQTHRAAIVFSRTADGWGDKFVFGEDAALEMPEIGISIPLAEIYDGIALESDIAEAD